MPSIKLLIDKAVSRNELENQILNTKIKAFIKPKAHDYLLCKLNRMKEVYNGCCSQAVCFVLLPLFIGIVHSNLNFTETE